MQEEVRSSFQQFHTTKCESHNVSIAPSGTDNKPWTETTPWYKTKGFSWVKTNHIFARTTPSKDTAAVIDVFSASLSPANAVIVTIYHSMHNICILGLKLSDALEGVLFNACPCKITGTSRAVRNINEGKHTKWRNMQMNIRLSHMMSSVMMQIDTRGAHQKRQAEHAGKI